MTAAAPQIVAVVPVKAPAKAKTRLSAVLDKAECAQLCLAMLDDLLTALTAATHVDKIAVITADAAVADHARQLGHEVLPDQHDDLNAALDDAAVELQQRGTQTLLVLPADLPTLSGADIDTLLESSKLTKDNAKRGMRLFGPRRHEGTSPAATCSRVNEV